MPTEPVRPQVGLVVLSDLDLPDGHVTGTFGTDHVRHRHATVSAPDPVDVVDLRRPPVEHPRRETLDAPGVTAGTSEVATAVAVAELGRFSTVSAGHVRRHWLDPGSSIAVPDGSCLTMRLPDSPSSYPSSVRRTVRVASLSRPSGSSASRRSRSPENHIGADPSSSGPPRVRVVSRFAFRP